MRENHSSFVSVYNVFYVPYLFIVMIIIVMRNHNFRCMSSQQILISIKRFILHDAAKPIVMKPNRAFSTNPAKSNCSRNDSLLIQCLQLTKDLVNGHSMLYLLTVVRVLS
jgi:hypothetical protein